MSFALRGRIARPAGPSWNLVKTLIQLALFWGFFLWLVPGVIHLYEVFYGFGAFAVGTTLKIVAYVIVFLGCWLGLSSAILMAAKGEGTPMPTDSTRKLVISGAYRYVRNPMVIAGSIQFGGVGLWLGSGMTLASLGVGILIWNFIIRPWEEWDMEERFGDAYLRYTAHVMCWRPRWKPYDSSEDAIVSFPRTIVRRDRVLLFDGHCKFCERHAFRLKAKTGVVLVNFQVPYSLDAFPGITREACMRRVHYVDECGRVWAGMEAVVALVRRYWWGKFALLYYLPGVRLYLDFWYGWVGTHRYFIWGSTTDCDDTCQLHS